MNSFRPDSVLMRFAGRLGFGAGTQITRLGGGVSCEVWKLAGAGQAAVAKRALPRLQVAEDWLAPVRRNATEWAWFETADQLVPGCTPPLLAHAPELNLFGMEFVDAPLWKAELLAGRVMPDFAAAVGHRLAQLHAASAGDEAIARRFATDDDFRALRLDPYLLTTARRHTELLPAIEALVARTASTHLALVHGDVSPKNILMGDNGPIFLDAETAWYGDPAFDLAFCLNHLLLKAVVVNRHDALAASFVALSDAYLSRVDWEAPAALEARAAALLPALMLARVDGKSPVEYLDQAGQARVRSFAPGLILAPRSRLGGFYAAWLAYLHSP